MYGTSDADVTQLAYVCWRTGVLCLYVSEGGGVRYGSEVFGDMGFRAVFVTAQCPFWDGDVFFGSGRVCV